MKYSSGENIELGDIIRLWDKCEGIIVGLIEEGRFREDYPKTEWGYLKEGLLVVTEDAGLIHVPEVEAGFCLISRHPK